MDTRHPLAQHDVAIIHLADARFYPLFQRQAFSLRDAGYRVAFVSWERRKGEGQPGWPGIDVYPVTIPAESFSGKLFFVRYMAELTLLLLRLRCRLYQAVDPVALLPARIAAAANHARHNYFSLEYFQGVPQLAGRPLTAAVWRWMERAGLAGCRNTACVCDSMGRLIARDYGIPLPRTIRNVPAAAEYAVPREGRLRTRIGVGPRVPLVVYKGDIAPGRGLALFVEALGAFPAIHFALIGDGPLAAELRARALALGINERVHFVGTVAPADFPAYLVDADLGHVIHENASLNMRITLPSKLFDYLHAGLPVIAGDGPEVSRIVNEHKVGWVTDPGSIDSVKKGIGAFIQALPHRDEYRTRSREAANAFCWEAEEKVYLKWITEALEGAA
jgi:glycosyltransferase involved in cell wall biosynthesis